MKTAYAYLRVSGKAQAAADKDGFTRQLLAIKGYAAAHDLKIVKVFREEGVSGETGFAHRPALFEVMNRLDQGSAEVVIFEKLDRIARDLMVQENILAEFRKKGVTAISVAEPDLCVDDPTRKLMRQIFGAIAEYDKQMIVAKLRGARERVRKETGRCEGRKPFGDDLLESTAIARMQELRRQGMGWAAIAGVLTLEGVPTKAGKRWHGATIQKILARRA